MTVQITADNNRPNRTKNSFDKTIQRRMGFLEVHQFEEDSFTAAIRETKEETGTIISDDQY